MKYGVEPDIMVTGKGIAGGMYPLACVLISENCAGWLKEDGFGHISTGGGAELGCIVSMKTLEIVQRPEVSTMVRHISNYLRSGLNNIMETYPDFFIEIRQHGVIMGLVFNDDQGAKPVMRHLYENGVWAIFSTLDPSVLQFKPGLLLTQSDAEEVLRRMAIAVELARAEVMGNRRRMV
jgi:acetylornithine/succinyldiaminopimelate/putrescine aminotransferase